MRIKNIILILLIFISFASCYAGPATYEVFENDRNYNVGHSRIPNANKKFREIYSEDKYIYKFKGDDPRCVYGYLTNRDDKPEKVIDWIIISGKEYCKEQQAYGFQI